MTVASCDTCRAPGSCCRGFVLSIGRLPEATWSDDAMALMSLHRLPFIPVRVSVNLGVDEAGYVAVVFDCTLLGADGRCTQYDDRPVTCRLYTPGADPICAEYVHTFKGIPVVVA